MSDYELREGWLSRLPGLELRRAADDQALMIYEPRDCTHYEMSVVPARWAPLSQRLGCVQRPFWQVSVWSGVGSGLNSGTMLIEAGTSETCVASSEFIAGEMKCAPYSAQVFTILINGGLLSHDLGVAREAIAHFRSAGRNGFVDPDAHD